MLLVDTIFVDEAIPGARFCCNLQACKGACCTLEGGRGAPVEDAEVSLMMGALPAAMAYLSPESLAELQRLGPFDGAPGNYATACIEHRECVFVYFDEHKVARCAFERAFREGRTSWAKPVSCHLFPIRVRSFGQQVLRYEQIDECRPARVHGEIENVALVDFLKEPLVRKFGDGWYSRLRGGSTTVAGDQ
jgi:hypothetical protein